jgi:hypothetical protein
LSLNFSSDIFLETLLNSLFLFDEKVDTDPGNPEIGARKTGGKALSLTILPVFICVESLLKGVVLWGSGMLMMMSSLVGRGVLICF